MSIFSVEENRQITEVMYTDALLPLASRLPLQAAFAADHQKWYSDDMEDITRILNEIEHGDHEATERLLPLVYDELRKFAAAKLGREKPDQTLQATALVHEAYMRLVKADVTVEWNGRGHFFGAAAEAMRRILVEKARQKLGPKRGGGRPHVSLDDAHDLCDPRYGEILSVHEALDALAEEAPVKAELVKLRYFAGLSHQDAADALGLSRSTADRHWKYAKAFLFAALQDESSS